MEGLPDLPVPAAYELNNAAAERSAAAAAIDLNPETVAAFLRESMDVLSKMIEAGYGDPHTLERRIAEMKNWL
ncbi:MAG: hypothetical protein KGY42_01780, partial [Desulfobacterales bacterium]|nr:hypothetical protein [Desulfobacterales bacterium]